MSEKLFEEGSNISAAYSEYVVPESDGRPLLVVEEEDIMEISDDVPQNLEDLDRPYTLLEEEITLAQEQGAKVHATDAKGKRKAQWAKADQKVKAMLDLEELPDQTLKDHEWESYGEAIARGDESAKHEFIMRRLRTFMLSAMKLHETQDESSSLTVEDHFQNTLEAVYKRIGQYKQGEQSFREQIAALPSRVVLRAAYNTAEQIRLPVNVQEELAEIGQDVLYSAETRGVEGEHAELLQAHITARRLVPLDSLEDIRGQGTSDIVKEVSEQLLKEDLRELMSNLPQVERRLLELHFGLNGEYPHTLEEARKKLAIDREKARQLENKALKKLEGIAGCEERILPMVKPVEIQEGLGKLPPTFEQINQARVYLARTRISPAWNAEQRHDRQSRIRLLEAYLAKYAPEIELAPLPIEIERANRELQGSSDPELQTVEEKIAA